MIFQSRMMSAMNLTRRLARIRIDRFPKSQPGVNNSFKNIPLGVNFQKSETKRTFSIDAGKYCSKPLGKLDIEVKVGGKKIAPFLSFLPLLFITPPPLPLSSYFTLVYFKKIKSFIFTDPLTKLYFHFC